MTSIPADSPVQGPAVAAGPRVPAWVWAGGVFLAVASVVLAIPGWADGHYTSTLTIYQLRLLLEGVAYLWAGACATLDPRVRRVLTLVGAISIVSFSVNIPLYAIGQDPPAWFITFNNLWVFFSYLLSALALLWWPRYATGRWEAPMLLLDLVLTAGAMGALLLIELTFPLADATPDALDTRWSLVYGLAQVVSLVGLGVMVMRGRPLPSRRAFWWFVAAQAAYVPMLFLSQLGMAEMISNTIGQVSYVAGVLLALVAVVLIRADAANPVPPGERPVGLQGLSPLALLTPMLVVGVLVNAMVAGPESRVPPLIAILILTTLLLVVRVLLGSAEGLARLREEAEKERRVQEDRLATVGRLAGGLAHEFNNMMTVVLGHAEFAERAMPVDSEVRRELAVIREQSDRASRLTRQLLSFSGQQVFQLDEVPVERLLVEVGPLLGAAVTVAPVNGLAPVPLRADLPLLAAALQQIARNAVEAGGREPPTLRVSLATLTAPLASPYLSAPPGRYARLEVQDQGEGILPADLPRLFDPFFSRKPTHAGGGLGLAEVYGVMVGHHGGITVRSVPGAGTTVTLYVPLA